jgi:hypothetical protein
VFKRTQVKLLNERFYIILSRSIYRQIPDLGVLGFVVTLLVFLRRVRLRKTHAFTKYFIFLTLCLFAINWLFFITNFGWRDWQTAFLSPLIFMAALLAFIDMPVVIAAAFITVSLYSHIRIFNFRYQTNLRPTSDPSLLINEMAAIDWTYAHSRGEGFSVYTYLPSIYDYPYQYLFPWYALPKYGFLPCEYATFPDAPLTYLPSPHAYRTLVKPCHNLRFLIIEPDKNTTTRNTWLNELSKNTSLIEEGRIGEIIVQKRVYLP